MFGKKRVPVLRLDRLGTTEVGSSDKRNGDTSGLTTDAIQYTFSSDPDTSYPLRGWDELNALLQSLGSGPDRTGIRLVRPAGRRRIAAEAFGSALLNRVVLRWSDSGVNTKSTPPWWFTTSAPTNKLVRIPIGDVPADFDELSPDAYEQYPDLDLASVPAESVVHVTDAANALRWFLTTWPAESSPALDWVSR